MIFTCSNNHISTYKFKKFYCNANVVILKLKARKRKGNKSTTVCMDLLLCMNWYFKRSCFLLTVLSWLSYVNSLVKILHFIGSFEWQIFKIHCQSHVFENFLNRSKNVTMPRNAEYCLWVKAQVEKSTDTTAGRVFPVLVLKTDLARHNCGTLVRKIDCRLFISASSRRTQSLRRNWP